jgi:hypothetical protein
MTDEQREANKRRQREYQRQYRARKKAELQNIGTSDVVTQIVSESSPACEKYLRLMHFLKCLRYLEPLFISEGASFGTGLSTILENDESEDPTDWLHRNDNYVPRPGGPRTVISGPLPASRESGEQTTSCYFSFQKI